MAEENSGSCTLSGDSGGPVHTVKQSNGPAYAKGIISGGKCETAPDDGECSDGCDGVCRVVFTDIAPAEKALPGVVKKWSPRSRRVIGVSRNDATSSVPGCYDPNFVHCPSETTSTEPSTTLMAVCSSMA